MSVLQPPLAVEPAELVGRLVTDPLRPLETTLFGPAVLERGLMYRLLGPTFDWDAITAGCDVPAYVRANGRVYLGSCASASRINWIVLATRENEPRRWRWGSASRLECCALLTTRSAARYIEDMFRPDGQPCRVSLERAVRQALQPALVLSMLWVFLSALALTAVALACGVLLAARCAEALLGPSARSNSLGEEAYARAGSLTTAVLAALGAAQMLVSTSCSTDVCYAWVGASAWQGVFGLIVCVRAGSLKNVTARARRDIANIANPGGKEVGAEKQGVELV